MIKIRCISTSHICHCICSTDKERWKEFISKPSLSYVLRLLTGLCNGHAKTQVLEEGRAGRKECGAGMMMGREVRVRIMYGSEGRWGMEERKRKEIKEGKEMD